MVARMSCTSPYVFHCISRNFAFGGRSITLLMYGPWGGGGGLSAARVQCGRSATIWVSSRTEHPYFVILGASLLPLV